MNQSINQSNLCVIVQTTTEVQTCGTRQPEMWQAHQSRPLLTNLKMSVNDNKEHRKLTIYSYGHI